MHAVHEIYKRIDETELALLGLRPTAETPAPGDDPDRRPAILFFFGGGWSSGDINQFRPHIEYFASRGLVALAADYRVKKRHGVTPFKCLEDARSAVRYLKANAAHLGLDPERIIVSGGSAGGHLAACCGLVHGYDDPADDLTITTTPAAMVLFNPVLDTTPAGWGAKSHNDTVARLIQQFGGRGEGVSPVHQVKPGAPPTILFHGDDDQTVPINQPRQFAQRMTDAGNRCDLIEFPGMGHGFFNHGRHGNQPFTRTVAAADQFLLSLGLLTGQPDLALLNAPG